jgi:adenylate cyclase
MTGAQSYGYLVLDPDAAEASPVPLVDRIFVGRECLGVDPSRRILLEDDLAISRNHLEVRVDHDSSQAVVIDTSSNGTRVNGIRIERAIGVPIHDRDRIQVGNHVLEFRSQETVTRGAERATRSGTVSIAAPITMVLVVGDLINFSTVAEQADGEVLARDVDRLYNELRGLLKEHRGTLVDYAGDAFFASWEIEADPAAVDHALGFALAASEKVAECAPQLELRYGDGTPMRMGFAATIGPVVMRLFSGSVVMALGDAVNLGFRIASLSGREGRPEIFATQAVRDASIGPFRFGKPETVTVKGRVGEETIYGVSAA